MDPFEEQFDLPSAAIDIGDGDGGQRSCWSGTPIACRSSLGIFELDNDAKRPKLPPQILRRKGRGGESCRTLESRAVGIQYELQTTASILTRQTQAVYFRCIDGFAWSFNRFGTLEYQHAFIHCNLLDELRER